MFPHRGFFLSEDFSSVDRVDNDWSEPIIFTTDSGEKNIKKKSQNIFGGMEMMLYICRNKK
jgi:hypothetical protein